jgi:hypothetical protein
MNIKAKEEGKISKKVCKIYEGSRLGVYGTVDPECCAL